MAAGSTLPVDSSTEPQRFLNGYEKFLLNTLAVFNIFFGTVFLLSIIFQCYQTLSADHVFWPDFMVYYTAAHMVRHAPALLYDYPSYLDFYHTLKPGIPLAWFGYIAPPPFAVFLLPLSYLSYTSAYLAWGAINMIILVLLAGATWILACELKLRELAFFLSSCVAGIWVTSNIIGKGQFSLLMCLAFTWLLICLLRKKPLGSAFWLAVLLQIKPPLFIPLFLYLAGCRQWRIISVTILLSLSCILTTLPFLGSPHIWLDYINTLRQFSAGTANADWHMRGMISLLGLCMSIFGEHYSRGLVTLNDILYFLFCGACFLWPWISRKQLNLAAAAAIAATGFFISPYFPIHDTILLLPVCVIACALMRERGNACWMFLCYLFASYAANPERWFLELLFLMLGVVALYLTLHKPKYLTTI